MPASRLPSYRYRGSLRSCGRGYGEQHADDIFYLTQALMRPDAKRLRYAERCWREVRTWHRGVAELITAIAAGARMPVEELTLLLLHEEHERRAHCTAFAATGAATRGRAPIIGQTWDWPTLLYKWGGILRLATDTLPATLTYALPGIWNAAGLNEHGLSLVWTSAGTAVRVPARVGVPTYALIAGILACRDCREALALVRRTRHAGNFIALIADAAGEAWVIEAMPARVEIMPVAEVAARANHFAHPAMGALVGQDLRTPTDHDSPGRARRMDRLLRRHRGRIGRAEAEAFLTAAGRPAICRDGRGQPTMSLSCFYCLPRRRELWLSNGPASRAPFYRESL
jgi:hypothetical protein